MNGVLDSFNEVIKNLDSKVEKIYDYLVRPFPDKRTWYPDETCTPFYLNHTASHAASGRIGLFTFKIPDNTIGIISKVYYDLTDFSGGLATAAAYQLKQTWRMKIVAGEMDDASALITPPIFIHGAIHKYQELTSAAVDSIGFANAPAEKECRIKLNSGPYRVIAIGSTGGDTYNHHVSLFGWTYPDSPRK